jgi:hypothetical protein
VLAAVLAPLPGLHVPLPGDDWPAAAQERSPSLGAPSTRASPRPTTSTAALSVSIDTDCPAEAAGASSATEQEQAEALVVEDVVVSTSLLTLLPSYRSPCATNVLSCTVRALPRLLLTHRPAHSPPQVDMDVSCSQPERSATTPLAAAAEVASPSMGGGAGGLGGEERGEEGRSQPSPAGSSRAGQTEAAAAAGGVPEVAGWSVNPMVAGLPELLPASIKAAASPAAGVAEEEQEEVRLSVTRKLPRKQSRGSSKIGFWRVCRVGEPVLSRPVRWRRSAALLETDTSRSSE